MTIIPKFQRHEAEHDAVCVEAMPKNLNPWEWPAAVPRKNKTSFAPAEECPRMTATHFYEYNARQIGNDPRMKVAPEGAREICFGTLGHSHLNQLFKNVLLGAMPVEPRLARYCDQEGRLDACLVAAQHPETKEVLEFGWKWRVLSWQFPLEEPTGPDVVQFVLNEKNAVAMLPSHWNMAIRMATYNATQARLGGELVFETILARVRAEGFSTIATRPDAVAVYDWVLNTGGELSSFWCEIQAFGRLYCQSNARKLAPQQYGASARYFEAGFPRLGLAYWRAAWFTNPCASRGVVAGLPSRQLASLYEKADNKQVVNRANELLYHLHDLNVGFWAARGGDSAVRCVEDRAVLDYNVIMFLLKGVSANTPAEKMLADIDAEAVAWDAQVRLDLTWAGSASAPAAPLPLALPATSAGLVAAAPASRKEPSNPKPVAQQWGVGGKSLAGAAPVTASSAAAEETEPEEELDWHASLDGDANLDRAQKTQFWHALNLTGAAYALAPAGGEQAPGDVVAKIVGKKTCVRAARAFEPGELVLVPLISSSNNLSTNATTPLRIPVAGLKLSDGEVSILPDVARKMVGAFLPPFWLMVRASATHMANMELRSVTVHLTGLPTVTQDEEGGVGPHPPRAQASMKAGFVANVQVPVATNPKAIKAGEELFLKSPSFAPAKAGGKPKASTWQAQAAKEPKATAAAGATKKPWER